MDTRRWGNPKSRRCLKTVFWFCFFVHHATAEYSPILDTQSLSESAADSRNKLEALNHLLPFNSEQDADYKRSSSFFPLRGKKFTAADMDSASYPFMSLQGDSEEKRSQFYPLRGKKIPDELKRGSYFMPMRGRKNDESWSEDEDDVDKRMSSFMPMRGKRKSGFLDTFPHLGKPGTYSTEIMYPSSSDSNRKKRDVALPASHDNKTAHPISESSIGNETAHSLQKRSSSFMPMRGRREYEPFGSQEIKTRLLEKKQYSFMPMRGRRYSFNDTNGRVELDLKFDIESTTSSSRSEPAFGDSENRIQNMDDKRTSSFMPMRGRRNPYDGISSIEYDAALQEEKRLSNFMPMRGRKNNVDSLDSSNDHGVYSDDKRSSSFMPMRGRKNDVENTHISNGHETYSDDKRSSSFMPMRGRRKLVEFTDFNGHEMSSEDKRSSSFMPMRGRREPLQGPNSFQDFDIKRGSYFMPMRGRRSIPDSFVENQMGSQRTKRSSSFMPMRGRKMDSSFADFMEKKSSSFMPMRGRRDFEDNLMQNPEEKKGSYFMPMRGRRGIFDSYFYNGYPRTISSGIGSSLMTRHFNGDFYPVSSLRRYVSKTRKFDWDSVKRAFHATRGKRFEVGKDSEEVWDSDDPSKSDNGKGCRYKRSIIRPRMPLKSHRQYIALKRPMSFFATRGKRLDESAIDSTASKLR